MIISKIKTLVLALKGVSLKLWLYLIKEQIIKRYAQKHTINREEPVVVSVTSYGRRVKSTLPYTILSIMRQTVKPDKIVIWLDNTWNDSLLSGVLLRMKEAGVLVEYCEDLKSYKKLLPSLVSYKDDIIITCDDDLYYDKGMVERLLNAHKEHPNCVCCQLAHEIVINNKEVAPYNEWKEEIYDKDGVLVFPLGGSGCLYKAEYLNKDVTNYELACSLAPKADDVWFYFMSLTNNINRYVLPYKKNEILPLDAFYQYFHRGSSLMEDNLSLKLNDKQIKSVMDYYSIDFSNYL